MNNLIDNIASGQQLISLLLVLLGGIVLGSIFFAGLYWTVQRGTTSAHPALWFLSSFLLRTTIVLTGIYLLADDQWPRLLLCMIGFIGARFVVITMTSPMSETAKKQEQRHAP
jgi:F1F0 ATPase subunit 2